MISVALVRRVRAPPRRWADHAATTALVLTSALLLALIVLRLTGFGTLVERSGSMAPAISPGDLLLTHAVPTRDIRLRDIVSFEDPAHPGVSTTHRVVALERDGARVLLTTRGDANQVAEQWPAPRAGRVQRVTQWIPSAGYAVAGLGDRWVRLVLLMITLSGLTTLALRRIWRTA